MANARSNVKAGMPQSIEYLNVNSLMYVLKAREHALNFEVKGAYSEHHKLLAEITVKHEERELFGFVATVHETVGGMQVIGVADVDKSELTEGQTLRAKRSDITSAIDIVRGDLSGDDAMYPVMSKIRSLVDTYTAYKSYDWISQGHKGKCNPSVFAIALTGVAAKRKVFNLGSEMRVTQEGEDRGASNKLITKFVLKNGETIVSDEFIGTYPPFVTLSSPERTRIAEVKVGPWSFIEAILAHQQRKPIQDAEPICKEILKQLLH